MALQKIIIGIDFSEYSLRAVEQGLLIGRKYDAQVVFVHAGSIPEQPQGLPASMEPVAAQFAEILQERCKQSREQLTALRQRHDDGAGRISHKLIDSLPVPGLIDAANELQADLVVVGTHGRTGFDRFMMGSVAERLIRHAPCSVMIARGSHLGPASYKRILVPTDFSRTAEQALELAAGLVGADGTIDILHCWQLEGTSDASVIPAPGGVYETLVSYQKESALVRGNALVERYQSRVPQPVLC